MILLFNESPRPWEINNNDFNERTGSFFKRKDSPVNDMHCFIRCMKEIVTPLDSDTVSKLVKMKEPVILGDSEKLTSLIHGKKDFNPFIIQSKNNHNTDILLITLNVGKRMIVSISKDFISVLEHYLLDGELTLIVAVNKRSKPLEIRLYDKYTKSDVVYTVTINDEEIKDVVEGTEIITEVVGKVVYSKKILDSKNEKEYRPYIISNFRPSRPTHTIFALKSDVNKLRELHPKFSNTSAFNIVEFNNIELPYIIKEIKAQRFNAVTLFVDSEYYNNRVKKFYSNALSLLEHDFKIFFIMLNNGNILKQKY